MTMLAKCINQRSYEHRRLRVAGNNPTPRTSAVAGRATGVISRLTHQVRPPLRCKGTSPRSLSSWGGACPA